VRKAKPKLLVLDGKENWVKAKREVGDYSAATDRSGKWICFTNENDAEQMWRLVASATKAGRLGSFSDMGPARKETRVIEVHTYDWTDADDVRRVRA